VKPPARANDNVAGLRQLALRIGAKDLRATVAAEVVVSAVIGQVNRAFSADVQANKRAAARRTKDRLHASHLLSSRIKLQQESPYDRPFKAIDDGAEIDLDVLDVNAKSPAGARDMCCAGARDHRLGWRAATVHTRTARIRSLDDHHVFAGAWRAASPAAPQPDRFR